MVKYRTFLSAILAFSVGQFIMGCSRGVSETSSNLRQEFAIEKYSESSCRSFCHLKGGSNCEDIVKRDLSTNVCSNLFWSDAVRDRVCVTNSTDHCPPEEPVSCEHAELVVSPKTLFTSSLVISGGAMDYVLLSHLGSGFCNDVRLAYSKSLNQNVALKCLRNVSHAGCAGMSYEAEFARHAQYFSLGIPVPRAYEVFINQDSRPCIAMELIGNSLMHLRKKEEIPLDRVAQIGLTLIQWATTAHAVGISHSDIHAGNIAQDDTKIVLLDLQGTQVADPAAIHKDAEDIAHTLVYLFTLKDEFWCNLNSRNTASGLIRSDVIAKTPVSHHLFDILDHTLDNLVIDWDWMQIKLATVSFHLNI